MSIDNAIVMIKYKNDKDNNISFRVQHVQAIENLRHSMWYVFNTFKDVPEWTSFSLADVYATKLEEKYGNDLEYGMIICDCTDKTWKDIAHEAGLETYKFSKEQPYIND